ncbi:MAG: inositol monophosphatase [Sulfurovum sp.]|nr:inositol monophosphatase [Sulfurovum sp.]
MKDIEILKSIAKQAGELIRGGYYEVKKIKYKGTVDLVTEYDVAVEKFVIGKLEEYFPEHTLVAEESHEGNYHYDKAIYIDPIDGTTNFVHGFPHLAISIGVWEGGEPMMAVVYNPILDELYWAVYGEGAYLGDKKLQVSKQNKLQQSLIGTGFPYAKVNQGVEYHWVIDCLTNLLPHIRDIRRLGAAAVDLCYLAEGKIDAFYEIDLKPWDVAGGILILLEAGGVISDANGDGYGFDSKSIVASNGKVHGQLLERLVQIS